MSDQRSETSPPDRFKEVCEQVRWLLSDADRKLGAVFDDDRHDTSVQMVAAEAANGLNAVMLMLALVEALGEGVRQRDAQWRDIAGPLVENADLDDATKAEMLDRIEHLEYATVAEGQLERLIEQLAGDVSDVIADKLKGGKAS